MTKYLILPSISDWEITALLAAVFVMVIAFILIRWYYTRTNSRLSKWLILQRYARSKDLTPAGLKVLKYYFNSMPSPEIEKIIVNNKEFQKSLQKMKKMQKK